MHAFPSNVAPIMGQQVTLRSDNFDVGRARLLVRMALDRDEDLLFDFDDRRARSS